MHVYGGVRRKAEVHGTLGDCRDIPINIRESSADLHLMYMSMFSFWLICWAFIQSPIIKKDMTAHVHHLQFSLTEAIPWLL